MQMFIVKGKVTCEDAADIYSSNEGRVIEVGDDEFRVVDDVENPGWSADYGSLDAARRDWPSAIFVEE